MTKDKMRRIIGYIDDAIFDLAEQKLELDNLDLDFAYDKLGLALAALDVELAFTDEDDVRPVDLREQLMYDMHEAAEDDDV